jgi:hypothetical protein
MRTLLTFDLKVLCNRYFEYPAVAALMTAVLKHGVQHGMLVSVSAAA